MTCTWSDKIRSGGLRGGLTVISRYVVNIHQDEVRREPSVPVA